MLPTPNTPPITTTSPISRLTPAQIQQKKHAGICFYCDDKYTRNHSCAKSHMSMITAVNENDEDEVEKMVETNGGLEEVDVSAEISLNAINGRINISTFKVLGQTRNGSFNILINSGDTHNFIDPTAAAKLECDLEDAQTMIVTISIREKAFSKQQCKGFP